MGIYSSCKSELCSGFVSERELLGLVEQERENIESELAYNPTNEEVVNEVVTILKETDNLHPDEEELSKCIKKVFEQYNETFIKRYMRELYITTFPQYKDKIRQGFINYKIGNISEKEAIEWLGELCLGDEESLYWELEHHAIKTKNGYVHA